MSIDIPVPSGKLRRMDKRAENIVDAAFRVFSRYGVKRTTMNDIAAEAGLVRQTLYNVFENKDEILRATIRLYSERAVAAVEADCARATNLGEKLDSVFRHMVVKPYEMLHAAPHTDEVLIGLKTVAKSEIEASEARHRALFEEILEPHANAIEAAGMTVPGLADIVQKTWGSLKVDVDSKKRLMALLAGLKIMVLAVAEPG